MTYVYWLEDHPDWTSTDLSSLTHVEAFSSFGRHPKVHVDDVWSPRQAFGLTETFTIISSDPADHAQMLCVTVKMLRHVDRQRARPTALRHSVRRPCSRTLERAPP